MGTTIEVGTDVVTFLRSQHRQVQRLLESVVVARGDVRQRDFGTLRRLLALHETAEEEIVHPLARRALVHGEAVVVARLGEEKEAKTILAELEALPADSAEFDRLARDLQVHVVAHTEAEEREEFGRLVVLLDAPTLTRMRKAAKLAETLGPTRPHPGIESATANLLVGPFAAMIDRARDALSEKP
jgi:hypothetical protein